VIKGGILLPLLPSVSFLKSKRREKDTVLKHNCEVLGTLQQDGDTGTFKRGAAVLACSIKAEAEGACPYLMPG